MALQIEDFINSTSTTPLSSVPLQFLVELFSSSEPCSGTRPTLVGETPPNGACIPVPFGTTSRISVVAMVVDSSNRWVQHYITYNQPFSCMLQYC